MNILQFEYNRWNTNTPLCVVNYDINNKGVCYYTYKILTFIKRRLRSSQKNHQYADSSTLTK